MIFPWTRSCGYGSTGESPQDGAVVQCYVSISCNLRKGRGRCGRTFTACRDKGATTGTDPMEDVRWKLMQHMNAAHDLTWQEAEDCVDYYANTKAWCETTTIQNAVGAKEDAGGWQSRSPAKRRSRSPVRLPVRLSEQHLRAMSTVELCQVIDMAQNELRSRGTGASAGQLGGLGRSVC